MELSKRLTVADMKRANVPRRFWHVSLDNIPDGYRYKELVQSYIDQLDEMFRQGVGCTYGAKKTRRVKQV